MFYVCTWEVAYTKFSEQTQDLFSSLYVCYSSIFFNFIYLFIFGCTGSSLMYAGFLLLQQVRATLLLWSTGSRTLGLQ